MTHVMVDLETLATSSNALILSIGAVKFDPTGDEISEKFHVGIDLASLPLNSYGLDIEAATVLWWLDAQRAAGREALEAVPKADIASVLEGFGMWLDNARGEIPFKGSPPSVKVWGNGASFDNVILRNAYTKLGMDAPWKFWDDRCYRTFKNLAPSMKTERMGAYHSALDDAVTQASHMQKIVRALKLTVVD